MCVALSMHHCAHIHSSDMSKSNGLGHVLNQNDWFVKAAQMLDANGLQPQFKPLPNNKTLPVDIKDCFLLFAGEFKYDCHDNYTGTISTSVSACVFKENTYWKPKTFELKSDASLTELLTFVQDACDNKGGVDISDWGRNVSGDSSSGDSSSEDEEDNKVYLPYDCSIRGEWFNEGYYSRSELPEDCMDSDGDFIVDDPRLEYFMAESTWNDPGK